MGQVTTAPLAKYIGSSEEDPRDKGAALLFRSPFLPPTAPIHLRAKPAPHTENPALEAPLWMVPSEGCWSPGQGWLLRPEDHGRKPLR